MGTRLIINIRPETFVKDIMEGIAKGNHTLDEALDMMEAVMRDIESAKVEG